MNRLCVVLSLGLALAPVPPPPEAPPAEWVEARSPHFHVVSDARPKKVQDVTRKLEEFRHLLHLMFPQMRLDAPVPTSVILFKGTKSFRPYQPLTPEGKPLQSAGFMQPGPDRMYLAVNLGAPEPEQMAFHEFKHLVLRLNFERCPLWLEEGLAEFFQRTTIVGDDFKTGDWHPGFWDLLQRNKLIPMEVLVEVDHRSDYYNVEEKRKLFYGQSWLLVHYLMVADEGKRQAQFVRFVELLRQGVPQPDAFQQALGTDYAGLHRQLRNYLLRSNLNLFQGKMTQRLEMGPVEVAPMPTALAQAYLSDLWLNSGRVDEAEKALASLAQAGPAPPEVLYRLGRIALFRNQLDTAEKHLREALRGRPDDISLRYYAAWAVSQNRLSGAVEPEERRAAATEVIELIAPVLEAKSDFPDAIHLLVQARLARDDPPAELIPLVERARQTGPRREDFDLLLAHLYLREQRWDDAEKLLQAIANEPESPNREQALAWLNRVRDGRQGTMRWGTARGESSEPAPARPAGEPVEPAPAAAPASPPEIRYVRGTLVNVACAGEGAVVTVQGESRKGAPGKTLHLAVRSLERVILIDPTESGQKLDCGPSGVPVTINYRVEPQGPSVAGVVMTIELYPPER